MKTPLSLFIGILMLSLLACGIFSPIATLQPRAVPPTAPANRPLEPQPTVMAANPVAAPQITSFKMFDEANGWALSEQSVLRTTTGGATWVTAFPAGVSFNGLPGSAYFSSASSAWVLVPDPGAPTSAGKLYASSDGGLNWSVLPVPFAVGQIQFLDIQHGFALISFNQTPGSADLALYQTSDSGVTWSRTFLTDPAAATSLPVSQAITGFYFRDPLHGWISGAKSSDTQSYLYSTADGGKTWAPQAVVENSELANANVTAYPPLFFNQNAGIFGLTVTSATVSETIFVITNDGGLTWLSTNSLPGPAGDKYAIVNPNYWLVWARTRFYASSDGGFSWLDFSPNQNFGDAAGDYLVSMSFISKTTGWALTMDANLRRVLYRTSDGGVTWQALAQ